MASLNYNHLRYFWTVAHEGGLTRAAERLNVSQSAVSVQIQKLEQQIGQPLFERSGKRLNLTEAGRIALDYADTVFAAGEELLGVLKGKPGQSRQILRVGALTTLSRNFQLGFLRPLVGRGDVELVVRSGGMGELMNQLEAHALDVVLSNFAPAQDAASATISRLLDEQPVSLIGPPTQETRPFKFPEDLDGRALIAPSLDSGVRQTFERLLALSGTRPDLVAEVDDMAMLRLLARESKVLALTPPIVVRDELDSGTLREYCRVPGLNERFYAIYQQRRFINPLLPPLLDRT